MMGYLENNFRNHFRALVSDGEMRYSVAEVFVSGVLVRCQMRTDEIAGYYGLVSSGRSV